MNLQELSRKLAERVLGAEMEVHLAREQEQAIYGVEVSPELISTVTDAVMEECLEWQQQPLKATYAIVYLDAIHVRIRDAGSVSTRAVYLAIGGRVLPRIGKPSQAVFERSLLQTERRQRGGPRVGPSERALPHVRRSHPTMEEADRKPLKEFFRLKIYAFLSLKQAYACIIVRFASTRYAFL